MKIESISDIPEALFYNLKLWADASITHWNIFVTLPMVLAIITVIASFYLIKKIGKADERTNGYYKNWAYFVLMSVIILDILFPKTYFIQQFFAYKYAISFFVGALYLGWQYKKDFT